MDLNSLALSLTLSQRKMKIPQSRFKTGPFSHGIISDKSTVVNLDQCNDYTESTREPEIVKPPLAFLKLPTELRLQVYRSLLVSKYRVKITKNELQNTKRPSDGQSLRVRFHLDMSNNDINSRVLRACRRVHDEASSILYGHNTWHFVVNTWFEDFLQHIGPNNASSIRYLHLRGFALDVSNWELAVTPCMMMSRLRTFELSLSAMEKRSERGQAEQEPEEKSKTVKSLQYMRMLLQIHPTLRAVTRTKIEGCSASYVYNLMLVSEDYRMKDNVGVTTSFEIQRLTICRTDTLTSNSKRPWYLNKEGQLAFRSF